MKASEIEKYIDCVKNAVGKEVHKGNYEDALKLISVCANILYYTNAKYVDDDVEKYLQDISDGLQISQSEDFDEYQDVILFWDGFGLNDRGLIQIYLKALCRVKKVVYVTYDDRKNCIPDILNILNENEAEVFYIKRCAKQIIKEINSLNDIIVKKKPLHFIFYSVPDDVVAIPLMYAYRGQIKRYQINLTDHAFWLGAGCCDVCINFRDYGAKISYEYRGIDKDKNVVIPFYPIIHYEKEFQGYPFEKKNKRVIFSGGNLYKTLGENNKYYKIVEHILLCHEDVIFWYAGSGDDSELRKIIDKFPGRVFHTGERSDLYRVMEHCDIYLSTYPMCGGLMFQYAAMAGIVPVTLKNGNISDDFLINQDEICIEFDSVEKLYAEIDRLLDDSAYAVERSQLMKKSVISHEVFENEVQKLFDVNRSMTFVTDYKHIDTKDFIGWYLDSAKKEDIELMFARTEYWKTLVKNIPMKFIKGMTLRLCNKLRKLGK